MNVAYESLLAHGRAVQYHRYRKGHPTAHWIELQLAGEQNDDGSARSWWIGFADKRSAKRSGASILRVLRELEVDHQINTDVRYNRLVETIAHRSKVMIAETNDRTLIDAEIAAKGAPSVPTLLALVQRAKSRQR